MLVFDCTTTMLWIILLATLSTVIAQKKSNLTPPSDVTAELGGSALFKCDMIFSEMPAMKWEFSQSIIYSFQYGKEDYPKENGKYAVFQNGTMFILQVKDLQYSDGGSYTCRSLNQAEEAKLIILGKPQLFTTSNLVEGNTEEFTCTAQFGGPRKEEISPQQYPQLRMLLDHKPLNRTATEHELECSANCYNLTLTYEFTLESSMNGKTLMCEMKTTRPAFQLNVTSEIDVLYSVRHISYSPNITQHIVGSEIKCIAEGNPKPTFQWINTKTGNFTNGQLLKISNEMANSNMWKCIARNNINGHSHEQSVAVAFDVVLPLESFSSEPGNDSWKIAVGVTLPIFLIISIVALCCYKKHRKPNQKMMRNGSNKNTLGNGQFDIQYSTLEQGEDTLSETAQKQQEERRYESLIKIVIDLDHEDDLSNEVVMEIQELLPKQGQSFPIGKQSPLVRFIRKSKYLIGSENYLPLMQTMVDIYRRNQDDMQEDPLSYLVVKLETVRLTTQYHTKLMKLLKMIIPLHGPAVTRSKCMWVLITKTMEWKTYKGEKPEDQNVNIEPLQWNSGLMEILRLLLEHDADPLWSPEGSSEGSSLHVFLTVLYEVGFTENLLGKSSIELLEKMVEESSSECNQLDGEGKTILHSLVSRKQSGTFPISSAKLQELVIQCKAKNFDLLNAKDNLKCTPLHTFLASVLPQNKTEVTEDILKFVNDIAPLLVTQNNVNIENEDSKTILHEVVNMMSPDASIEVNEGYFQLLKLVKSLSNVDIQDVEGNTALHHLTKTAKDWSVYPKLFTDIVKSLASSVNIDLKNDNELTALCIFTGFADDWVNQSENFLEVVKVLVSEINITYQDGKGRTPLELFSKSGKNWTGVSETFVKIFKCLISPNVNIRNKEGKTILDIFDSWEADVSDHPKAFLEIAKIFQSSGNLDIQDNTGATMLYKFILCAQKWKDHPETFLAVCKCLKSPSNIDITNFKGNTPLHRFLRKVGEWKYHLKTYIDVIKCFKSIKNIDIKNLNGEIPMHILTAQAAEWSNHRKDFIEVVKSFKSKSNIDFKNMWDNTPLHRFTIEAGEWKDHLQDYLKVVKLLYSSYNIQILNGMGETALQNFVEKVKGRDEPGLYFEIVKCLASPTNIDFKNYLTEDTALHSFTSKAGDWKHHPGTFYKVVQCLISSTSSDIQNSQKNTALHIFTSQAGEWKNCPKEFLEVVKCLRSSTNIEFQNEDGATALHVFISKAGEWRENTDMILAVIQWLVSPTNINIKTEMNNTALHTLVSRANEWKDHGQAFLTVLSNLISPSNLDIKNALKETALNAFISKAGDWKDQPQVFLDVMKCLVSGTNIDKANIRGATALQKFTSYVDVWKEHPQEFIKVVKFLKDSSPNSVNFQDNDQDTVLQYLFFSFINWESNQEAFRNISNKYSNDFGVDMEIKTIGEPHFICLLKPRYKFIPELLLDFFKKFSGITVNHKKGGETEIQISKSSRGEWKNSPRVFVELVKCLATPININLQNQDEDTALHYFARCEREWVDHQDISEIVKCLMSPKNICMVNKAGETALDVFRQNWGEGAEKITEIASALGIKT